MLFTLTSLAEHASRSNISEGGLNPLARSHPGPTAASQPAEAGFAENCRNTETGVLLHTYVRTKSSSYDIHDPDLGRRVRRGISFKRLDPCVDVFVTRRIETPGYA